MAEETEILVYPHLRISELEAQAALARERFFRNRDKTVDQAKQTFHPSNLLRNHKASLVAATVAFLLFGKLFTTATKFVAPKLKSGALLGLMKTGWMWTALELSYKLYKLTSKK